jgi:plastocyanin
MSEVQPQRPERRLGSRQLAGVGLLLATALLVVACGGSSSSSSGATGTVPGPTSTTTPTPSSASPSSSPSSLNLAAKGSQLQFSTNALTAKAGKVTIDFTNNSALQHNVTLSDSGNKIVGNTPTFVGGSKSFSATLKPGTYTYYCSVPGHRQAGMQGTLTVK